MNKDLSAVVSEENQQSKSSILILYQIMKH